MWTKAQQRCQQLLLIAAASGAMLCSLAAAAPAAALSAPAGGHATKACTDNADCSLNGVCAGGLCQCDKPWGGAKCGIMQYAVTPAAGKDLYNISDPRNTWNGPIVKDPLPGGKFHLYNPLYNKGSLGGPPSVLHGIADDVYGPWDWHKMPPVCPQKCGENPAALSFPDAASGKTVYTIWIGGKVMSGSSASGPFSDSGFTYPGGNPAPIYHKEHKMIYLTNQVTTAIYTTSPTLDPEANWTKFADVDHSNVQPGARPEDPFMWIDKRGNWHVINHAYDVSQFTDCGTSILSTHFFSKDGKNWRAADDEPYGHTVHFDDGTVHTYTTLERPNIHFDSTGQMTHLGLAADLVTGNEGCANRTWRSGGKTCCTNCKYNDHAGTLLVKLQQ